MAGALIGVVLIDDIVLQRSKELQEAANAFIAETLGRTSRISLRHTVSALISPEEMRKTSSDATPSFPCAGEL